MSAPSSDPDGDEELVALVSELETALVDLKSELADRERGRQRRADVDRWDRRRRRSPPRPPSVDELFRFTTDYTIPTVVAILEATIESLELLRRVLDLAAPGETPERRGRRGNRRDRRGLGRSILSDAVADGVTSATDRAATDAADALSRLRETLAEADLPEDEQSRDLVADARDLSAELERRVRESRETADAERLRERRREETGDRDRTGDRERHERDGRESRTGDGDTNERERRGADGPVTIAVGGPGEPSDSAPADGSATDETDTDSRGSADASTGDASADDSPEVDVDAELESIKREMGKDTEGDDDAGTAADADSGDDSGDDREPE